MMTIEIDAPNSGIEFTIVIENTSLLYSHNLQFYSTGHTIILSLRSKIMIVKLLYYRFDHNLDDLTEVNARLENLANLLSQFNKIL